MRQVEQDCHADGPRLDAWLPERTFATLVDRLRQGNCEPAIDLVPLLSVSHELYRGRSAGSSARMRAYALAAFHDTGLPDEAVPHIVEILETSYRPVLVAAAARAVRGMTVPDARLADYLIRSIHNVWQNDEPVSFDAYDVTWPLENYSTALSEVLVALASLGNAADHVIPELEALRFGFPERFNPRVRDEISQCIESLRSSAPCSSGACCRSAQLIETDIVTMGGDLDIAEVGLEDQNGHKLVWHQFFHGKPSAVAFFYATCMNPRKCVQTIYNLVAVHRSLRDIGLDDQVRVAAITYDPHRDTASVLRRYGESKGLRFGPDCRMMRVPTQFDSVLTAFNLGVNFIDNQVNDHRIELYLLDRNGSIAHRFLRVQADPEDVVAALAQLNESSARTNR